VIHYTRIIRFCQLLFLSFLVDIFCSFCYAVPRVNSYLNICREK
jgi:hypothetical protein